MNSNVPSLQIFGTPFVWSFLFFNLLIMALKRFPEFRASINKKNLITYFGAGAILAVNWGTFIYAVQFRAYG
jgi:EamA domain-containing membrane protein RarD